MGGTFNELENCLYLEWLDIYLDIVVGILGDRPEEEADASYQAMNGHQQ